MSPEVVAAIIAASVSFLTLIGSLLAQTYGIRRTSRDTEKWINANQEQVDQTLAEQREQLNRTFTEQRERLEKILTEQGKQLDRTLAEQRARTLNERFATAADRLGSDKPAAVRLAGVYAMAGLADDWEENRQTCVDVLCAYLRMPYEPAPGADSLAPERLAFDANREVRHTVIRIIGEHLRPGTAASWQGLNLDFTGVDFDGGDFSGARFSGREVNFSRAQFSGGLVSFDGAEFSGGTATFSGAQFSGGKVDFDRAVFSGSEVDFGLAWFSGSKVHFGGDFFGAQVSAGLVSFDGAHFSAGEVDFRTVRFSGGQVIFNGAKFAGSEVDFRSAKFAGSKVSFGGGPCRERSSTRPGTIGYTDPAWSDATFITSGARFS